MLGIPLALLIGFISGLAALLVLAAATHEVQGYAQVAGAVGELLAIPTFWFGGPWLTTQLVQALAITEVMPYYLVTLAIVFTAISVVPIVLLEFSIAKQIRKIIAG